MFTILYDVLIGVMVGSVAVFIGATIGAIAAMCIGRYAIRDFIHEKTKKWPKFQAIEEAIQEEGFKLVLLLRL